MTWKEHHDAVSAAAKEVYEAIERANRRGIVVNMRIGVNCDIDGSVQYFPIIDTYLLFKGRKVMTEKEKKLSERVKIAMSMLADAFTSAEKEGYSFTIKRMPGSMFAVKPAESSIEA